MNNQDDNFRPATNPSDTASRSDDDGLPVGAIAKLLVAGLVIAAVVIFVLQNLDNVPVNFLSWSFDAPLILLLAAAAVAGVLLRWIVSFLRSRRKGKSAS